jgi:hypothetical protein
MKRKVVAVRRQSAQAFSGGAESRGRFRANARKFSVFSHFWQLLASGCKRDLDRIQWH